MAVGRLGHKYFRGVGTVWTAFVAGSLEKVLPVAYSCALCGRCRDLCALGIDAPAMIQKLRNELVRRKTTLRGLDEACKNLEKTGNPCGLEGLSEIPSSALLC